LHFFLDGVIETANQSIDTSKAITSLRDLDMGKIQGLGKREAESGVKFLQYLYAHPLVTISNVAEGMNFTRPGAGKLIERLVSLGILTQLNETATYGRTYFYKSYVDLFNRD
jgi:predicted transcriptional regulator